MWFSVFIRGSSGLYVVIGFSDDVADFGWLYVIVADCG